MALVVKDRVKEISTSTGTGSFTLSGAVAGFQTFASTLTDGDTTYYAITDAGTGDFEVGLGTYNSGVLTRDTVFETHNGLALVDFNAGEKEVFITYPADKAVYLDADGKVAPTTALMDTIKANDGAGSGLNADLLDGLQASDFVLKAGDTVAGNLTISGDLTVNGTTTTVNATNLAIADNMIYMNDGSTVTNPDLGWSGNYNDGTYAHAGFFRDATDGRFKAYDGYTPEPDASPYIDTSHASFSLADIEANTFYGNLTGTATNANKWTTARTITLGGDLTGSVSIDGTANVVLTAAINDDSHFHVISNIDGLQSALDAKADDATLISAGTGLTGGGDLSVNRTLSLDTAYTDGRYVNATGDTMAGDLSSTAFIGTAQSSTTPSTDNARFDGFGVQGNRTTNPIYLHNWGIGGVRISSNGSLGIANGILVTDGGLNVTGNIILSGTVDGRDVAADGTKLDGIEAGATADQTITAGAGLTGGGIGDVTISHADTSTQVSVNNSGATVIQDVTLDTYGHVTGLASKTLTAADVGAITGNQTITLSGDVSGTGTTSIAVTVSDDSHNHSFSTGNFTVGNLLIGGIGAQTTGGVLDWNDASNARSGSGYTLLLGTATNGPSTSGYYHPFTFEYNSKNGSGNMTQFAIPYNGDTLFSRYRYGGVWTGWTQYFSDTYHPNADKWTTARTLTLNGDVSGSVAWDGSGNVTLTTTVADDSHNHVISNVDGLQTALDGKLATTGKAADSNLLDGLDSSQFLRADANDSTTGTLSAATFNATSTTNGGFQGIAADSATNPSFTWTSDLDTGMYRSGTNQIGFTTGGTVACTISGSNFNVVGALNAPTVDTNSVVIGAGVTLSEATDRADLLLIKSSTAGWAGLQIQNTSNEGLWSFMTDGTTGGIYDDMSNAWHIQFIDGGETRLYHAGSEKLNTTTGGVYITGDLTASGNVTAYSDERLKSNIQTIEGAVDTVKALRGVTFEKDGRASLGVIAQEVQKVLPEVVQEGEEYLSVAYGNIVGLLIEAIKEQQTQIDELKAKLEG